MSNQTIRFMPVFGFLIAVILLIVAAAWYPSETEWYRATVSRLCARTTPAGDPNPIWGIAVVGLFVVGASKALLFQLISAKATNRYQGNTIQIAGIGSMVYALLTATPMHDLMVSIASLFYVTALLAVLYLLFSKRMLLLFVLGFACLSVLLVSEISYYANMFTSVLGVIQKFTFVLCTSWLLGVHFMLQPEQNLQTN